MVNFRELQGKMLQKALVSPILSKSDARITLSYVGREYRLLTVPLTVPC
jgi:hypothetical protein